MRGPARGAEVRLQDSADGLDDGPGFPRDVLLGRDVAFSRSSPTRSCTWARRDTAFSPRRRRSARWPARSILSVRPLAPRPGTDLPLGGGGVRRSTIVFGLSRSFPLTLLALAGDRPRRRDLDGDPPDDPPVHHPGPPARAHDLDQHDLLHGRARSSESSRPAWSRPSSRRRHSASPSRSSRAASRRSSSRPRSPPRAPIDPALRLRRRAWTAEAIPGLDIVRCIGVLVRDTRYGALRIDPSDATPIWSQIEEGIRRLVASGALAPGRPSPPCATWPGSSASTPRRSAKAYQRLTDAGVLTVRRGDGTYVADAPPALSKRASGAASLREAATRYASWRCDPGSHARGGGGGSVAAWRDLRGPERRSANDSDKPPIRIEGLTVRYGRAPPAPDVISLAVAPGSVYALLGRNGAGKSSLDALPARPAEAVRGHARSSSRDSWTTPASARWRRSASSPRSRTRRPR